ncbi:MAG TPA: hypothetical protein PK453_02415 [Leptospiraceae bacterium]|nr:hypothetical protein [Leptospiraceae bacterium]HNF12496.1 hypothetical protein [Leptospiraceae bacterium]HNF24709.1 hypothetical protein [Leptospiraceae bacterium]
MSSRTRRISKRTVKNRKSCRECTVSVIQAEADQAVTYAEELQTNSLKISLSQTSGGSNL